MRSRNALPPLPFRRPPAAPSPRPRAAADRSSYPTEYVKTQLQLFSEKAKLGPIQCARETIRTDGVLGLYRGLPALLWFSVPKVSSRFFAFEMLKNQLQGPSGSLTTANTLLCGIGAGTAEAVLAVTPMDTIKTRLIHDQLTRAPADRKYRGFFHGVRTIVAEHGFGGVYKGLTATILKQASNQAIRWVVFLRAKEAMAGPGGDVSKLGHCHCAILIPAPVKQNPGMKQVTSLLSAPRLVSAFFSSLNRA